MGFERATDMIDGVEGWKAVGLPLVRQTDEPAAERDQAVALEGLDGGAVEVG
jgi:hypothetical protein